MKDDCEKSVKDILKSSESKKRKKRDVGSNATLDKYQYRGTGPYAMHDIWLIG
jgi:hypothetical protein